MYKRTRSYCIIHIAYSHLLFVLSLYNIILFFFVMHIIKMYFTFFINIFFLYIYIIIQIGPRTQNHTARKAREYHIIKKRAHVHTYAHARDPNALRASNQNPNAKPKYKQTQFQNTKQKAAVTSRHKNVIYNFPASTHTGGKIHISNFKTL
jgi:predicted membrane protein